jgi:WD40 repeat protein
MTRKWTLPNTRPTSRRPVFTPDGKRVAVSASNETLICDTETGQVQSRVPLSANLMGFTADGRTLITTAENRTQLWQTDTGQFLLDLGIYAPFFNISCLVASPDNCFIATGGSWRDVNLGVYVWEAQLGEQKARAP